MEQDAQTQRPLRLPRPPQARPGLPSSAHAAGSEGLGGGSKSPARIQDPTPTSDRAVHRRLLLRGGQAGDRKPPASGRLQQAVDEKPEAPKHDERDPGCDHGPSSQRWKGKQVDLNQRSQRNEDRQAKDQHKVNYNDLPGPRVIWPTHYSANHRQSKQQADQDHVQRLQPNHCSDHNPSTAGEATGSRPRAGTSGTAFWTMPGRASSSGAACWLRPFQAQKQQPWSRAPRFHDPQQAVGSVRG